MSYFIEVLVDPSVHIKIHKLHWRWLQFNVEILVEDSLENLLWLKGAYVKGGMRGDVRHPCVGPQSCCWWSCGVWDWLGCLGLDEDVVGIRPGNEAVSSRAWVSNPLPHPGSKARNTQAGRAGEDGVSWYRRAEEVWQVNRWPYVLCEYPVLILSDATLLNPSQCWRQSNILYQC